MIRKTIFAVAALCMSVGLAQANPTSGNTHTMDDTVRANASDYTWLSFVGGETANADLIGFCSVGQDIDLWVYDENDNLAGKSTDYGCTESVEWYPRWTGPFKIVIENQNHPWPTSYHLSLY